MGRDPAGVVRRSTDWLPVESWKSGRWSSGTGILPVQFVLVPDDAFQGYSTLFQTTRRLPFHRLAHNSGSSVPAGFRLLNAGSRSRQSLSTLVNLTVIEPLTVSILQLLDG